MPIREIQKYGGVRIRIDGMLDGARVALWIDIGFGDAVTPPAVDIEYPTLLGQPAPNVRAYPPETVIAEKLEAIVSLGLINSRIKDYHDLLTISTRFMFEGETLVQAIRSTFQRRGTAVPPGDPDGLTSLFAADRARTQQWNILAARLGDTHSFNEVVDLLRVFLLPPLHASGSAAPFSSQWRPGGPWGASPTD